MLTFTQMAAEAQDQAQDLSAGTLRLIKRGINQGMHKFGAILNREWRDVERTFSTVANQQYYQNPEDAIRIAGITITNGGESYPLTEIADRETWDNLNRSVSTSSAPEFYYLKGSDQFGIFPTPAATGAQNGLLTFEANMRDMNVDDYTTGTVLVTAGSPEVVGTGTVFNAAMVGRTFMCDPTGGNGDGAPYKVQAFTDATHITLENNFAGNTTTGQSYLIGQVPDIPEEFHESLVDYAMYRFYRKRRDLPTAKDLKGAFDEAILLCQANYSSKSSSQYMRAPRTTHGGYVHVRRDQFIP